MASGTFRGIEIRTTQSIQVFTDEMNKFGTTTTDASVRLREAFGRTKREERERQKKQVNATQPFMALFTDPDVTFLRRSVAPQHAIGPDGSRRHKSDVSPNWVVTFGVALSVETREVEFWLSSPLATTCWRVGPERAVITHLTTNDPHAWHPNNLERRWIEELGRAATSPGAMRFTHDLVIPEKTENEPSIADLYRDMQREVQEQYDWGDQWRTPVKIDDWAKPYRSTIPGITTTPTWKSTPETYTISSDSAMPLSLSVDEKQFVQVNDEFMVSDSSMDDNEYRSITRQEMYRLKEELSKDDKRW